MMFNKINKYVLVVNQPKYTESTFVVSSFFCDK